MEVVPVVRLALVIRTHPRSISLTLLRSRSINWFPHTPLDIIMQPPQRRGMFRRLHTTTQKKQFRSMLPRPSMSKLQAVPTTMP